MGQQLKKIQMQMNSLQNDTTPSINQLCINSSARFWHTGHYVLPILPRARRAIQITGDIFSEPSSKAALQEYFELVSFRI